VRPLVVPTGAPCAVRSQGRRAPCSGPLEFQTTTECPADIVDTEVSATREDVVRRVRRRARRLYECSPDSWRTVDHRTMTGTVKLADRVLIDLHRAASLAGRPGIAVPSRDLEAANQAFGPRSTRDALSRLRHDGRLLSVRKDLDILPDATGRVTVGLPDLVRVVAPAVHLITGGRALEEHRLTDQHYFALVVLVPRPVDGFSFRKDHATFLVTQPSHIWGWQQSGPQFAVPERAILDAVSHSRYGVSLSHAIKALRRAAQRDPGFLRRLADATHRYHSVATARRLGPVIDRVFVSEAAAPFEDLVGERRSPVLLRPSGLESGEIDRKWRVVVNATAELERASA